MAPPINPHLYRINRNTHVPITSAFSERLDARITLTLLVRKKGGRRRTTHTCQASEAIATAKKSGCNRSSQRRQPALISENSPSPARTCGNIHQLGVSRAAMIDNSPALLGSLFTSSPDPHYTSLRSSGIEAGRPVKSRPRPADLL